MPILLHLLQDTLYRGRVLTVLFLLLIVATVSASNSYATSAMKSALVEKSLLLDVFTVDSLVVAVGERGHILYSNDSGNNWQQAEVPSRATLTGVFFHDSRLGWAVGHDQVVLRTLDGGRTWTLLFSAPEEESPLLDVWFADAEHGYAIGAYGRFLETSDGGESWSSRWISEDDFHLNKMFSVGNSLVIAAEAGSVYRSDDGGTIWQALKTPYEGSFFGGIALDSSSMLILGLRGNIYRSSDLGETWQPIESSTEANLTDAVRLEHDRILIVGLAGTLLLSHDGGTTFAPLRRNDRKGYSAVQVTADGTIVAVGEFGVKTIEPVMLDIEH